MPSRIDIIGQNGPSGDHYDAVNHPLHYTFGKYEVIDVIEDWGMGYHLGTAIKYIARAGKKNPDKYKEDLQKAIWFLQRAITNHEETQDTGDCI